jgi:hypothetical protein
MKAGYFRGLDANIAATISADQRRRFVQDTSLIVGGTEGDNQRRLGSRADRGCHHAVSRCPHEFLEQAPPIDLLMDRFAPLMRSSAHVSKARRPVADKRHPILEAMPKEEVHEAASDGSLA